MKVAICNELFKGWATDEVFGLISRLGYDGVEIAPFTYAPRVTDITDETRRMIIKKKEEYGLDIAGLHWVLVGPEGLHLTHPKSRIRVNTRDYLKDLINFCGDIGGKIIVFGSPKQRNLPQGVSLEKGFLLAAEVFQGCMAQAARRGVTVCIEPLSFRETDFISTGEQARRLCELVDHPNFRMMVDVKAMSTEKKPMAEIVFENAAYIHHVHLNDASGKGPGLGGTDLRPVIQALKDTGFSGYLSVEVFEDLNEPEKTAEKSLEYVRSLL